MSLPQNYTIKEHAYLWRADGSSGTQGTGSIVNYPTLTGGTASATLSQVTTAEVPTIPNGTGTLPGTGSFIKVVASGGERRQHRCVHQHSRKKPGSGGEFRILLLRSCWWEYGHHRQYVLCRQQFRIFQILYFLS